MKSGNTEITFETKIKLKEFVNAHADRNCAGGFQIGFTTNAFYSSSALGPIKLPCIPQVMCHTCGTAYTIPGFEDWIDRIIVDHLVVSKDSLSKKQIKFLRQFFGFTQDELAGKIGLSGGKAELSKMESETSTRHMSSDTQVRLKLHFAKLLKIKDVDSVYIINEIDDTKIAKVESAWFPEENALRKAIKTG